ncbi:MAG: enoyl-CoA hydratase [Acidobacteria bacterium]|nr:MAG: enoyl-CoA hydratase [Acidobacteriota bacterium]
MSGTPQELVLVDRPAERVVRLTIDRPPVNALSRALVARLTDAAATAADDPAAACVVLAARGRAFCAGADLKERRGMSDAEVVETVEAIGRMTAAVAAIPVPTLAAVHGAALGGGLELALACDLRIAAEDARLGLPECSLAIIPGAGGTQRLPRIAGPAVAKRWIFTGRVGTAAEALAGGIVDRVVPAERLEQETLALAGEIARCGPLALRAAKRAIDDGLDAARLDEGLAIERRAYRTIVDTEDRREALRAFAEKRPPRFEGR